MSDPANEKITAINLLPTQSVDWDLEISADTNKITSTLAYEDDFKGWLSRAPVIRSNHPDVGTLLLRKIKGVRQEGYKIKVTLTYECNDPSATYPGREPGKIRRYTIEPQTGEESLLTFRKLKDLDLSSKEALQILFSSGRTKNDFDQAAFDLLTAGDDPNANEAYKLIKNGTEAYEHAGIMWVERFSTKDLDDLQCAKFYKIDADVPGSPPTLADGRNWLYVPGTATPNADGESWEMERRWWESLDGGWDVWLYGVDSP